MIIVLTGVTIFAALVLASVFSLLNPKIEENRKEALNRSLAEIFEDAENPQFSRLDSEDYSIYRETDESGALLGYVVRVEATGYGGPIQLLIGISGSLERIVGIDIVEHSETPGLGGRIQENWFKEQFSGLDPERDIAYVKNEEPDADENEIQAISGATISSKAIVSAVNENIAEAISIIRELNE
jgi:RnfABCDGE-type electron transport complex G subunit